MQVPSQDDIEQVFATGLDDDFHMWFGCLLKDGRIVTICHDRDECVVMEEANHAAAPE